ncbi:MAG: hypothetical protein WD993_03595 [Thermoleophilaceae bacterium]
MANATSIGRAGLQGWRAKVGDGMAEPVAARTPLEPDHVRAAVGAIFFALSVIYVYKTIKVASKEARRG